MNSKKSQIENLPEIYKSQIKKLSNETLKIIYQKREKTLEYASKGIIQTEPKNNNEEHVALIADSMQILAGIILNERGVSADN